MKHLFTLISLTLMIGLVPNSSSAEICSLPSADVARDAGLTIGLKNPCGFDVAVDFTVTFPDGKKEIRQLIAPECGGFDFWQGSNEWQVDAFNYEYDDARPALCGGAATQ
jgi:hypothetical protein